MRIHTVKRIAAIAASAILLAACGGIKMQPGAGGVSWGASKIADTGSFTLQVKNESSHAVRVTCNLGWSEYVSGFVSNKQPYDVGVVGPGQTVSKTESIGATSTDKIWGDCSGS